MRESAYPCKVTVAKPEEVGEILAFYEQRRTHAVYLRNEQDIRHSVDNELFAITRNARGQIIAASGVYILANGESVECIKNGKTLHGVVAELGSVLRWEEGLPEESRIEGVWHPFLFSVPMILLAQKVGRNPGQIPVDYLVADVQTTERSVLKRLTEGRMPGSLTPLFWTIINHPGQGLIDAFKKTVNKEDANVDKEKFFLSGSIGNLGNVAAYLRKCIRVGLTNRSGGKLAIDMSDLVERWTENPDRKPGQSRITVLDRMVANSGVLDKFGNMPWFTLPRIFSEDAVRKPEPLVIRGANANSYDSSPVTLVSSQGEIVGSSPSRPDMRANPPDARAQPTGT